MFNVSCHHPESIEGFSVVLQRSSRPFDFPGLSIAIQSRGKEKRAEMQWLKFKQAMGGVLVLVSMISTLALSRGAAAQTCEELFKSSLDLSARDLQKVDPSETLKAQSIRLGRRLGLSRADVEAALLGWTQNGIIGGDTHIKLLLTNENLGERVTVLNPNRSREYVHTNSREIYTTSDMRELRTRYGSQMASTEERIEKSRQMADGIPYLHHTPALKQVLALWYFETMDDVLRALSKDASWDISKKLTRLVLPARKTVFYGTLLGATGLGISAVTPGLSIGLATPAEIIAGLGASVGAMQYLERFAAGRWLAEGFGGKGLKLPKPLSDRLKDQATSLSPDEITRHVVTEVPPFSIETSGEPLTLELRAEVLRAAISISYMRDLDIRRSEMASLIPPLARLSLDTLKNQYERWDQMIDASIRLRRKEYTAQTKTEMLALRANSQRLLNDTEFTLGKMSQFRRLFAEAKRNPDITSNASVMDSIDHFDQLLEKSIGSAQQILTDKQSKFTEAMRRLQAGWL